MKHDHALSLDELAVLSCLSEPPSPETEERISSLRCECVNGTVCRVCEQRLTHSIRSIAEMLGLEGAEGKARVSKALIKPRNRRWVRTDHDTRRPGGEQYRYGLNRGVLSVIRPIFAGKPVPHVWDAKKKVWRDGDGKWVR